MSELSVNRQNSLIGSSRVIPIFDDGPDSTSQFTNGEEQIASVHLPPPEMRDGGGGDEVSGEFNPVDAWLPLTESRNGSSLTATFQLLCSGIGIQVLQLPVALAYLGWLWGIFCLSTAFSWQLYTKWLLVQLHESSPVTGIRYSRFVHLSIVAFGEKLGKLLAIFPTMYLSGGTCTIYIIMGGAVTRMFFKSICGADLNGAFCFFAFISVAIFTAQFFPNLNSLSSVALVGSITALAYCGILWIVPLAKGESDVGETKPILVTGNPAGIRDAFIGFEMLAVCFRGHNLVLEIQGTLPSSRKRPSRISMWRGMTISSLLIALSVYPMALLGYRIYENKIPTNGGMLAALQKNSSKHVVGAVSLMIIIDYICSFQIYAMPTFDNLERIYVTKKNKPCSRWVRSSIKIFFGGLTFFIAMTFPFLPQLGAFIGAIALPLTLVYPCLMWLAIKKPRRFTRMWWLNVGLGSCGSVLALVFLAAALWSLIANGVNANFYRP